MANEFMRGVTVVSTHSRLKAAGDSLLSICLSAACFNTQPPEGGWIIIYLLIGSDDSFNTQPPEGGWLYTTVSSLVTSGFQHTAA